MAFSESEILEELDSAFHGKPGRYFPAGVPGDTLLNFFPDLEHGYCLTAGNRIHLYADSDHWAIVFEKSGYQNRRTSAEIELSYFGNCINYQIEHYPTGNYITNSYCVVLIDADEYGRIENSEGDEMQTFEFIGKHIQEIKIRNKFVPIENDYTHYEKAGVPITEENNPGRLIGFGDLIRYLHQTNPQLISATEDELRTHLTADVPKLMQIDHYHFESAYNKTNPPSQQECWKLIAGVLISQDAGNWSPTLAPNNNWRNWESGNL
ncbi:MAG: hypothetical protein M9898_05170 [Chitinophagaceae bacterium]|nr:hypothetical protein [Chitinophagaceae bacterium]